MICTNCQHEMNPQERFCSRCGIDSFANRGRPSDSSRTRNWETHVAVLGWIFIASSLFLAVPGLVLLLVPGLMMSRMDHNPSPFQAMFALFAIPLISVSIGSILAGIGLLNHRDWARILALIIAAFMLAGFPFGTAIGVYAFWVLLSSDGSRSYKRSVSAERKSLA